MTRMNKKILNTWDREILRRIYGHVVEQGIWRIRNNKELMELRKDIDVVVADRTAVRMEH
jgi:hypothetical protein